MIILGSPPAPSPPCPPCGGSSSRRHGRCLSSGRGGPGGSDYDDDDGDGDDDSDGDGDGGVNLLNEAHLPERALADHFDRLEVVHAKPTSLQSAGEMKKSILQLKKIDPSVTQS